MMLGVNYLPKKLNMGRGAMMTAQKLKVLKRIAKGNFHFSSTSPYLKELQELVLEGLVSTANMGRFTPTCFLTIEGDRALASVLEYTNE
jgi:hypothetical protein